ncbi:hypothetical protein [Actinoalloteichus hymeniacidonis]|uniref:hypothetical protein n=1 Tax=Actinoalloteichus hymeniacidonis TaxID=340345 RepID=UPI000853834D|nr:hypothetical protein [Actinoalloteichus hymeniacidonis]MBB5905918.1 hypothetical protein [Actinoalloteichus hymeniacidonis]
MVSPGRSGGLGNVGAQGCRKPFPLRFLRTARLLPGAAPREQDFCSLPVATADGESAVLASLA